MGVRIAFFNLRRAMWRSLALMVVMLGVYILVGRQLTPMVERTVPTLENYFSELLEQPVVIDDIQGEWRGFGPAFTIRGLSIGDEFTLDSLSLEPALLNSLIKQNVIFSRFSVNGADIGIVHDGDSWGVPAFEAVGRDQVLQDAFEQIYQQLLEQDAIQLRNLGLHFSGLGESMTVNLVDALIIGSDEYHELTGELLIEPDAQAVAASVQIEARDIRSDPVIRTYLRHDQLDGSGWLAALADNASFRLQELTLAAQWWFEWRGRDLISVQSQVQRGGVAFDTPEDDALQTLSELSLALYWSPVEQDSGNHTLRIRDLSFMYNDQPWSPTHHDIRLTPDQLTLDTNQLSIGRVGSLVQPWLPMPLFDRHGIQGQLSDIQIQVPRQDDNWQWQNFSVTGSLQEGHFEAGGDIPGFERVDGRFWASAENGLLELTPGPLTVRLPGVLPEDIEADVDQGSVAWQLSDEQTLTIASGPLAFRWADEIDVDGKFSFVGNLKQNNSVSVQPVLSFEIAGDRLTTERLFSALPEALNAEVLDWMHQNLHDLEGGAWSVVLPNLLSPHEPTRIGEISARIDHLAVSIDEGWPRAEALAGHFFLDHGGILAELTQGRFSELDLSEGRVSLPFVNETPFIQITGRAEGLASDAWRLVTNTPIREQMPDDLLSWQMAGQLSGGMNLMIPLVESPEVDLNLAMEIKQGALRLPNLDLSFTDIQGPLNLSTSAGLNSDRVTARVFGDPLEAAIHTRVLDNGEWAMWFPGEGHIDLSAVGHWLNDPWLQRHPHVVDYSGIVNVEDGEVRLDVRSDLVGLPLALPEPLAKAADKTRPLRLRMNFAESANRFSGSYDNVLELDLTTSVSGELRAGGVALGTTLGAVSEEALRVDVNLPELEAAAWMQTIEELQQLYGLGLAENTTLDDQLEIWADAPLEQFRLRTGSLITEGLTLNDLVVDMVHQDGGWVVDLDAREVSGIVALSSDSAQRSLIRLDYLRLGELDTAVQLPEPVPVEELDDLEPERLTREPHVYRPGDDWLTQLNLAMVPRIDVSLSELLIGGQSYGNWQFAVDPDLEERELRFSEVVGQLRSVEVLGDLVWSMPEFGWHSTSMNLSAMTGNVGDVLVASGLTPVVTSQRASMQVEGRWDGSPAAFQTTGVVGRMTFDARDGNLRELDEFDGIRLIGLLNVTRIFRRLSLDFRDVFSAGVSYDQVAGELLFDEGQVAVGDRLLLDGSGAKMFFGGGYDMLADDLDAEGVIIARVTNAAGLIALGAGFSPPVALMVIFGERAFERELERLFSVRTRISGSLAQPDVRTSRLFDSDIRGNETTLEERMRELFGPGANQ